MKKSLAIISFAFIFLLSVSLVSASWFNDLFSERTTGDVVITGKITQATCDATCSPRTGTLTSSGQQCTCSAYTIANKDNAAARVPRGFTPTIAVNGGTCYLPPAESQMRNLEKLWGNRGGPQPIKAKGACRSGGQSGTYVKNSNGFYCDTAGKDARN